ncbi:MAG: LysR family transcriptional regulator [Legionella sp.]|jgi:DNA-binding transcriptional LysR family regulator
MRIKNSLIDILPQLAVFAKTVERGSFRKAALDLRVSPSVVSYHISQLEAHFKTALLYRTTRQLSLTSEGEKIFEYAQKILLEAQNSFNALSNTSMTRTGKITLTLPSVMLQHPVFENLSNFAKNYPLVNLDIRITDQRLNLIEQGIDLAIRIGTLSDNQASLKQKKLSQINRILIAGRELVANRKTPKTPKDLADWPWIGLSMLPYYRTLINSKGRKTKVHFQPNITVDSVDAMTQLAKSNLGVATPPDYLIQDALKSGGIEHLLPSWSIEPIAVYIVWPIQSRSTSLSYLLMDYLFAAKNDCKDKIQHSR